MKPQVMLDEYVFCTFIDAKYGDYPELSPIASYLEKEGLTLVVPKENADKSHINYEGVFKCINLDIHSSLEAVGLTAAVSSKLAKKGISANVIAAYYHDHIFVPIDKCELAMIALNEFCH